MEEKIIYEIFQQATDSLAGSGMIPQKVSMDEATVLLGKGSVFDSVALITFFSEVEERLSVKTGSEIILMLNDIHEFNAGKQQLTAGVLAKFILQIK